MTQAKHTPAPWMYENGKGIKACGNPLKVAGRTKVAIANRALIAAAPELYEALSELTTWCRGYEQDINNPMAKKYLKMAEAVLAKVKAGV